MVEGKKVVDFVIAGMFKDLTEIKMVVIAVFACISWY